MEATLVMVNHFVRKVYFYFSTPAVSRRQSDGMDTVTNKKF